MEAKVKTPQIQVIDECRTPVMVTLIWTNKNITLQWSAALSDKERAKNIRVSWGEHNHQIHFRITPPIWDRNLERNQRSEVTKTRHKAWFKTKFFEQNWPPNLKMALERLSSPLTRIRDVRNRAVKMDVFSRSSEVLIFEVATYSDLSTDESYTQEKQTEVGIRKSDRKYRRLGNDSVQRWNIFFLDGSDSNRYYWNDLGTDEKCFSKKKSGSGSTLVSAGFSYYGRSPIGFLEGRKDSACFAHDVYTPRGRLGLTVG